MLQKWAREQVSAKSGTELLPPATMRTAVFQNTLTCPDATGGTACQCTFTAYFGYDFKWLSATQIQVTRFTMRWAEGSTGTCEPEITRGSGAFDFQCVGDKQPCQFTGGNIFSCPCDTRIQFVPLTGTADECICPNTQNKTDYAQGVCGAPVWIEKTCTFQWIDLNFQHKVTCSCPDGHISRGFLTVVAQFSNGAIQFGGDWVPKTGLP